MNRIRKIDGIYQVLITPSIKVSPDSALLIGNWDDENLRCYHVLTFTTLQDAQCEAFKHPDIDWHRLVLNHEFIFERLNLKIEEILKEYNFKVEFRAKLMPPEEFKNLMFDRVLAVGRRFNMRYGFNDLITFTIVNPWTTNLHKISKILETHRDHLYLDVLRIRSKHIVDGKIIYLHGHTEFGTVYEIKLIPTLVDQWAQWKATCGYNKDDPKGWNEIMEQQRQIDNGITFI